MGDKWMEIYRERGGRFELVPLTGSDGQRINYLGVDLFNLSNHNSDKLYFGNSLQFRRGVLNTTVGDFMRKGSKGWKILSMCLNFDYNMLKSGGIQKYHVLVFGNKASEADHAAPDPRKYSRAPVYYSVFMYNAESGLRLEKTLCTDVAAGTPRNETGS